MNAKPHTMPFVQRSRALSNLGFKNYKDYLGSDLWAAIRSRVFKVKGRKCIGCQSRANQVHHKDYSLKTMSGEDISALSPVCRKCHRLIEFDGQRKTGLDEANARLHAQGQVAFLIDSLQTKDGGWTKESLEHLGVPWPPPEGWKKRLIAGVIVATPETIAAEAARETRNAASLAKGRRRAAKFESSPKAVRYAAANPPPYQGDTR